MQAWQYMQQGKIDPANQLLKMIHGKPEYELYAAVLDAGLLNLEGNSQLALEKLQPALQSDKLRVPATIVQAQALHRAGDSLQAIELLNQLLTDDPDLIDAHRELATIYVDFEA